MSPPNKDLNGVWLSPRQKNLHSIQPWFSMTPWPSLAFKSRHIPKKKKRFWDTHWTYNLWLQTYFKPEVDRVQTPILRKIIYSKTDKRHDYFRLELTIQGKSTTASKSLPGHMILTALGGFTLAFPIDSFISWQCVICLSVLMQLRWERGTYEHQNHIGYFQTFF